MKDQAASILARLRDVAKKHKISYQQAEEADASYLRITIYDLRFKQSKKDGMAYSPPLSH